VATGVTVITAVNAWGGGRRGKWGAEGYKGSYTLSCQLLEGHEQRLILTQLAPLLLFTEEENADVK